LSLRAIARRFGRTDSTVRLWVLRAGDTRLARIDWSDRPSGNPHPIRTSATRETAILALREWLRKHSSLGECGAAAIRHALLVSGQLAPCARTIARILARHGVARVQRQRRPAPPAGWYLPDLAAARAELDSFDFVEGLAFRGGSHFDALTAISLWGSLSGAWPLPSGANSPRTRQLLEAHWRKWRLPRYAQFDNDAVFQGSHGHPAHLGRIVHFCLCLGVIPIFTPPREQGFQNKLESFNAYWQQKVWQRRPFRNHRELARSNDAFLRAHQAKHASRREAAPPRTPFPRVLARSPAADRVIFLRRADHKAKVSLCSQTFTLPSSYAYRLVRCEWHLRRQKLFVFALHRRHPEDQRLLRQIPWKIALTPWFSTPR